MTLDPAQEPDDIATLKALLAAERGAKIEHEQRAQEAEQRAEKAEARALDLDGQIAHLKLTIAKMRHDTHGASSVRGAKLIDQMELQLADLVETVTEGKVATAIASPLPAPEPVQKPARRPLPAHLPRERVVHPAAPVCACSGQLRKLGEDITETLEYVPAQWKVIQHVREKFSCRLCDKITQAPAPSHPIPRGRAGPQLLA